jgi:glutamine amidotransferase
MTIALIDYGVGNLASVMKALGAVGAVAYRANEAGSLAGAAAIVIPGVGHFAATARLNELWRSDLSAAIARGVPLLGICLGMQWLFDGSLEATHVPGLGAMNGTCRRLAGDIKIPHVGWNTLEPMRPSRLLDGLAPGSAAYFTHSYAAPVGEDTIATTSHGAPFASVVERGRAFGVQWHPEKSGKAGLTLLANFLAIARDAAC